MDGEEETEEIARNIENWLKNSNELSQLESKHTSTTINARESIIQRPATNFKILRQVLETELHNGQGTSSMQPIKNEQNFELQKICSSATNHTLLRQMLDKGKDSGLVNTNSLSQTNKDLAETLNVKVEASDMSINSQIIQEDRLSNDDKDLVKCSSSESFHSSYEQKANHESQNSFLEGFSLTKRNQIAEEQNCDVDAEPVLRKSRRKSKPRRIFQDDTEKFSCKDCGKELSSKSRLAAHELKCSNDSAKNTVTESKDDSGEETEIEDLHVDEFSDDSEDSYEITEEVKFDLNTQDSTDSNFVCPYCPKTFKTSSGLKSHVGLIHSPKETFVCSYCKETFHKRKEFSEHVFNVHNDKKAFACEICGNAYELIESLRRHARVHDEKNTLACEVCGKRFTERITLQRHLNIHTGVKPYTCPECGLGFRDPSTMRKHIKRHGPERPFKCETCGKAFASTYDMKKHSRIHMSEEERPYKCEVCGKGFYLIAAMKTHVRIHRGERPFKCDICDFAFADARNLRTHQKIHNKEKDQQCELCGARFLWASCLARHVQIVHEKVKSFACSICGKKFGQKGAMKIHETTHSTERPFKCEECGKDFTCKTALKSHQRVHSVIKRFVCQYCDKGFNRGFQLKRHLLRCGKSNDNLSTLVEFSQDIDSKEDDMEENMVHLEGLDSSVLDLSTSTDTVMQFEQFTENVGVVNHEVH